MTAQGLDQVTLYDFDLSVQIPVAKIVTFMDREIDCTVTGAIYMGTPCWLVEPAEADLHRMEIKTLRTSTPPSTRSLFIIKLACSCDLCRQATQ
ncbi:hypothetical protein ACSMXN_09415 [Jatrophihabitans sp. DSM 45814]